MTFAERLPARGYHVQFRRGQPNPCPGCGRSHWWIGRVTAECAFCGTAIALPEAIRIGGTFRVTMRRAA